MNFGHYLLTFFKIMIKYFYIKFCEVLFAMTLSNYSRNVGFLLNKLNIPDITEPIKMNIIWFRAVFPGDDKSANISTKMHRHTFFEMHLVIDGNFKYKTQSDTYNLESLSGAVFAPGIDHIVKSYSESFLKFSLAFSIDEQSEFYRLLNEKKSFTFNITPSLLSQIDSILYETHNPCIFSEVLIKNSILQIISSSAKSIGVSSPSQNTLFQSEDKRVTAAKLYIDDNQGKFLTCLDVAKHCHLSQKQMERIFFAGTGKHLLSYIHSEKIKEAQRLLSTTDLATKEISDFLGFSSVYYFSSFFTKNVGIPPAKFRSLSGKTNK